MKYTITLNQPLMIKYDLNMTKWCMLDILSVAPTWSDIIVVDNKPYYHISRNKIVDELKALDLKPDTVYRYLKELAENGFILYIKKDGKDLITFTQKAKNLFRENHSEKNPNSYENSENFPNKLGKKSENHSEKNPTYKDTRIYKNTNIKERRENNSNLTNAKKETAPLSFSKNENDKSEINPKEIIEAYRNQISNKHSDIQEPTSFNIITQHSNEFKQILTGIMNYGKSLKHSNKKPEKLFFFIRNKIYLDYQVETVEQQDINPGIKSSGPYQSKADRTKNFMNNYYARKAKALESDNQIIDAEVIS